MTPYYSLVIGETTVTQALADRGLTPVWKSVIEDQQPGQARTLEWKAGDYTATAVRYLRANTGGNLMHPPMYAIVLTATTAPQMEEWHRSTLKALSKASVEGPYVFEKRAKELGAG
jgi:hypothetical protein